MAKQQLSAKIILLVISIALITTISSQYIYSNILSVNDINCGVAGPPNCYVSRVEEKGFPFPYLVAYEEGMINIDVSNDIETSDTDYEEAVRPVLFLASYITHFLIILTIYSLYALIRKNHENIRH